LEELASGGRREVMVSAAFFLRKKKFNGKYFYINIFHSFAGKYFINNIFRS